MSDIPSTGPDNSAVLEQNQAPSHYERRLDSFPVVSEKTGRVIIDTENNVVTILVSSETKKETEALSEDGLKAGYLRQGYSKIELNNGLWKLFNKKGEEIPIFSNEYSTATLNAVNTMWDIKDALEDEIKKRKINN